MLRSQRVVAPCVRAGLRRRAWAAVRGLVLAMSLGLGACASLVPSSSPTPPEAITVSVTADGRTQAYVFSSALTVREALAQIGVAVGELDRLSPAPYSRIAPGADIRVVRVSESFETELVALPFASDIVRNESLPEGERRLLQAGSNGEMEITYRSVFEDGVQVSRNIVKRVVLSPPAREIIMVGSQASFTPVPITGTLAYLNGQNAWIIRQNSGQRRPVTTSGDLDGRVFDLSPDGQWLLYTRAVTLSTAPDFNTLWAVSLTGTLTATTPIDLQISNVLYGEWSPVETLTRTLAYSTADKTARPPGWQANNDLWRLSWVENRRTRRLDFTREQLLDRSSGGVYGWWGTGFAYAPDGQSIAYARTDAIGVIDLETLAPAELVQFSAYNTHSDWAWYPAVRWAPDGQFIYTVTHGPPLGFELPEDSPVFNVSALSTSGRQIDLIPRAGMFANPMPSPGRRLESGERAFRVAFLQATEPHASPFSTYRVGIIDRDGSNVRFVFPPSDQPGLSANQTVAWSPDGRLLALIYQGNLWLVDPDSGLTQQLTGDGLSDQPVWTR